MLSRKLYQKEINKYPLFYGLITISILFFVGISLTYAIPQMNYDIFKKIDGSCHWKNIKIFSNSVGISFVNTQTGFVCSKNGDVFRTTNGGSNWIYKGRVGSTVDLSGISFASDEVGFACNKNGWIYKTIDGGCHWKNIKIFSNSVGISFVNTQTGFVCSKNGDVFMTTSGGSNWIYKGRVGSTVDLSGISFASDEVGFVCNKNGWIYKTSDGG
jgi:photosystem II stability/assembly factor-like uncharacterized protein